MPHEDEKELIKRNTRRLQKLKEQQASMGVYTPAHILTEIEDTEAEIEKLRTKDDVRKILSLCNRRAISTRFHAQISIEAMFKSLDDCRLALQKMVGNIESEKLQRNVAGIIGDLDLIERQKQKLAENFSEAQNVINDAKLRIIKVLVKLSEDVGVPYTLPRSLMEDAFFTKEEADSAPAEI